MQFMLGSFFLPISRSGSEIFLIWCKSYPQSSFTNKKNVGMPILSSQCPPCFGSDTLRGLPNSLPTPRPHREPFSMPDFWLPLPFQDQWSAFQTGGDFALFFCGPWISHSGEFNWYEMLQKMNPSWGNTCLLLPLNSCRIDDIRRKWSLAA